MMLSASVCACCWLSAGRVTCRVSSLSSTLPSSTCLLYTSYGMCTDKNFDEDTSNLVVGPINKQRWIYSVSKQLLDLSLIHIYFDGDLL